MRATWGDSAFVLTGCVAVGTVGFVVNAGCGEAAGGVGVEGWAAATGCASTARFAGLRATAPTVTDTFFFLFVSFIIKIKNSLAPDSFKTFFEPCNGLSNARAAHASDLGYSLNYW
jgi:hypothetical protein